MVLLTDAGSQRCGLTDVDAAGISTDHTSPFGESVRFAPCWRLAVLDGEQRRRCLVSWRFVPGCLRAFTGMGLTMPSPLLLRHPACGTAANWRVVF